MKNQEDEFYGELDKRKLHQSCCTGPTMIIFFVALLILAIGLTLFCYNKAKKVSFSPKEILSTFQDKNDFEKKIDRAAREQEFTIPFTSAELTAIATRGISGRGFIIKNMQVAITPTDIEIFGTLTKPLNTKIKIIAVPEAAQGKLSFKVQKTTVGELTMPQLVNAKLTTGLNESLDQNFKDLYQSAEIQAVNLSEDKMIVQGKAK